MQEHEPKAGDSSHSSTSATQDPRKLPTRQRFVDLILSYFQIPSSAYSRIPYESGWLSGGAAQRSSYSAVSHTSRKVRKLHRSGQPWMGTSIVPKLAIAPVFTAFTVCAVINFGAVEPGTRTVAMTRSAREAPPTPRVENTERTRLPSTASTRRSASGLRSSTATSAPIPPDCCTAFRKHSRCSSSRLSPSRLVYSQPLFVEIHSDWRRRIVEKPAR